MTYDYEIKLLDISTDTNGMGDPVQVVSNETWVLCSIFSIGSKEFYQAAAHDMKPEIKFIVNKFEYSGQEYVEHENKLYRVVRTFTNYGSSKSMDEFETMELTCEGVRKNAFT